MAEANDEITVKLNVEGGTELARLLSEREELLAALKKLVYHPELEWAEELRVSRKDFVSAISLIARIEAHRPDVEKVDGQWRWARDVKNGEVVTIPNECYRDLGGDLQKRVRDKEKP